jgi:hypothetical protein
VVGVWRGLAPSRTELLMWFIIGDRLNTTSREKRLNVGTEEVAVVYNLDESEGLLGCSDAHDVRFQHEIYGVYAI